MAIDLEATSTIDKAKYIALIRQYYDKELAYDLFSSNAEHAGAIPLRVKILEYVAEKGMANKESEVETLWTHYLNTHYNDKQKFNQKVTNAYFTEDFIHLKFKQNLEIDRYFNLVMIPRIEKDLQEREKTLKVTQEKSLIINEKQLKEKYYQAVENLGGEVEFGAFLRNNNLTLAEFMFLIKSDLLNN